ncbi:MAG: hypothetical protein HXY20_06530 [Acidobacteria bacterium]|nr:hypothetical protein [Acidobacteriota bacterium]
MIKRALTAPFCLLCCLTLSGSQVDSPVPPGMLYIGWSDRDITPDKPVALSGQFHKRISTRVEAPLWATVLALETRDGERPIDQAIFASCDLIGIDDTIPPRLRRKLAGRIEGFDLRRLILNATHTHTGPVTGEKWYEVTEEGVMKPGDYIEFLLERLAEAVIEAWQARKPGGVNWGLGFATVGFNRRMVYADGRAAMYGRNDVGDFRHVEGYEDSVVETIFFFDANRRLSGVAVNVACPSQVVEGESYISSDFWHDVRVVLRERFSKNLHVLAWTGASGDLSPHPQIRRAAESRMRKMSGDIPETRAIALRIAGAATYAYNAVRNGILTRIPFAHHVQVLQLPARKVTESEYRAARAACEGIRLKSREQWSRQDFARLAWHQEVVDRYEHPEQHASYAAELHILRLGDVAVATNPFELFLDYGIQMKTRSRALQTFVIQLACGDGGYLPTERAVSGGGYSAVAESGLVGPEGGRILVERSLEAINRFWEKQPQ